MGGVAKKAKDVIKKPGRALAAVATGGISEAIQKDPYGMPLPFKNPVRGIAGKLLGMKDGDGGGNGFGGFGVSPEELAAERARIDALGESQYQQTLKAIAENEAAQTKFAGETFQRDVPQIAETLNAQGLLNSSGYGTELARRQSELASQVAAQSAAQRAAALAARQEFSTGGLQRTQSIEDFMRQANVAQVLGAQAAPQVNNSKGQTGALLTGVGSLLPGIGGLASRFAGNQMNGDDDYQDYQYGRGKIPKRV